MGNDSLLKFDARYDISFALYHPCRADKRNVQFNERDRALYSQYFKIVVADTPALLHAVYRLRYQVYCVEQSFERADAFSDRLETDSYDAHSVHAALIHVNSGTVCGCVRLILPGYGLLPIRELVADQQVRRCLDRLPRPTTAEVSRYAVSKLFRRRSGEHEVADAHFLDLDDREWRRLLPHLTIGLMVGVATLSMTHGISHLCAVMAPALLKLLRTLGMDFSPVGPVVDHHGTRQPSFATAADLLQGLRQRNRGYYDFLASQLDTPKVFSERRPRWATATSDENPTDPSYTADTGNTVLELGDLGQFHRSGVKEHHAVA